MTAKTILYLNGANKIIQTKCLIYTVQQKDLYRATKTIDGKIENNAARGEAVCKSHVCIHVYIVLKCVCVCVFGGGGSQALDRIFTHGCPVHAVLKQQPAYGIFQV